MSARNGFRRIAVSNGLKTTNFVANPALATSYNLTLPSTVPTLPGQSLISDTSGNLTWGSSVGVVSTSTGTTNPLTTPTNVTGLLPSTTSSSISVYVSINATTNIYGLYTLKIYQKGSASSWGLAYDLDTDPDDTDPQVVFTVTSTGQVQYTIPSTIAGFTSVVMMWTLGNSVSSTLSSIALTSNLSVGGTSVFTGAIQGTSLALSSTFNVTGPATLTAMSGLSLVLGNASGSGPVSSTVGSFLNVQSQTYTDTGTAASGTAAGTFSASYLGVPTLAATNTGVTTGTASTLTIAGPPVAGTNETITKAYSLNIVSGDAFFAGNLTTIRLTCTPSFITYTWAGPNQPIGNENSSYFIVRAQSSDNALNGMFSGTSITFPITGTYSVCWYPRMLNATTTSFVEFYVYTTTSTASFGASNFHIAQQGGYIYNATLTFQARFVAGESISLLGASAASNSFQGSTGVDHNLSIIMTARG